ncbi:MAG: hypothetical protein H0W88_07230 [Parachlamydiaceae bacterium]|nr:hypothetical protein [Parachlamydiaceae bacterium]
MTKSIGLGDCVKIPDGRIGRFIEKKGNQYKIRVRRKTSILQSDSNCDLDHAKA